MISNLGLMAGSDVLIPQMRCSMHQPSLKEIGIIGQRTLFTACQLFRFSKESLSPQDRVKLINYSEFDIIMSMLRDKNLDAKKHRQYAFMLLGLLFPNCDIKVAQDGIQLIREQTTYKLDENNFQVFRANLSQIFCLKGYTNDDYKAAGAMSQRLIDKINAGKAKRQAALPEAEDKSIISRMISVLSTGQNIDMGTISNYTLYQLYQQYKRYHLKREYDSYIQYKIAGAKNLPQPKDWTADFKELEQWSDIRKFNK